ncbi:MAG: hypothetical protein FJ388_10290 [Verrucomicrobia bacterium]|nr:hypothetical protein [Verrucomicrobiota bacterium]
MSFEHPILDLLWSVVLLAAEVATLVHWWRSRAQNPWAYASLVVGLVSAFPAAARLRLPESWVASSPLMGTIGPQAGTVAMLLGALAWGLSIIALLVHYNWRPAREVGGTMAAYMGGAIGVLTLVLGVGRLIER